MKEIYCEPIIIKGKLTRHEIVQTVVNVFIQTEFENRGKGVRFNYPVERFTDGSSLFIFRPAGLRKWNFDFKVNVTPEMGLGKGTHAEIAMDFTNKKKENGRGFVELIKTMEEMCTGKEADVSEILKKYQSLQTSFQTGSNVEVLLKVLKWMFIMEDIVYWNYDGRMKLYNYLKEV